MNFKMELKVRNFKGIERADIPLAGIQLICGSNNAGKTSIVQAAQAVLAGIEMPGERAKKDADKLVRDGQSKAHAELVANGNSLRVQWPNPKLDGVSPICSRFAVGAPKKPFETATKREKALFLAHLLDADPTDNDIRAELQDKGVVDATINEVIEDVRAVGWEGALEKHKNEGIKLKGEFRAATGVNYNQENANWRPERLTTTLEEMDAEKLANRVKKAKEAYEAAIRADAITEAEKEDLEARAGLYPSLVEEHEEMEARLADLTSKITEGEKNLPKVPTKLADSKHKCPKCSAELVFLDGALKEAGNAETKDELQKALEKQKAARAEVEKLREEAEALRGEMIRTQVDIKDAHAARESLATKKVGDKPDVEAAAAALNDANLDIDAQEAYEKAQRAKRMIETEATICKMLQPEGLRSAALYKAVEVFNTRLESISKAAGWHFAVRLDQDFDLCYAGRAYPEMAESEQYKCLITLQAAIAELDKSQVLVIDRADLLAKDGRKGLMKLLKHMKRPAIVAMTYNNKEDVPDMAAAGLGARWWIEDGKAVNF